MATTSLNWRHRGMIKDMEESYRTKEEVLGIEFEPVKLMSGFVALTSLTS